MYRLFVAGAIFMCLLLFDAKLNAKQKSGAQNLSESYLSPYPELQRTYEKTKALLEKKEPSKLPTEQNMIDSPPSPVAGKENNSEKISAYYNSVTDAYLPESVEKKRDYYEPLAHQLEEEKA